MKKTAVLIMIITIFSKLSGFARDLTLSYFYGASNISDAYLISTTIPGIIFGFIGAGISTGYIPIYSEIENDYGVKEGNEFTSNLINVLLIISTIIIAFGLLFTEQIVKLFASGFEENTLKLAVKFTRIGLLSIYFTALKSIFTGFLQIKKNYLIPAIVGIPMNMLIILSIHLSFNNNIIILAIGTFIATIVQIFLLLPYVYKKGYKYKFIIKVDNRHIKNMVYIVLPVVVGVSVNQINILVDRTLASRIVVGGISALNYANKLNGFVQGIFVLSVATALYPNISKMTAEGNISGFKKSISEAISGINLLIIPSTIGTIIFVEEIVKLLFGRGAFTHQAIFLTSYALFFYSIGMIGFGLRQILSRAFYSMQDTKTPMINAGIAMIMNIILNIILSKFLGIGGLALATSISAIFCTLLLFVSLRRKIGPFGIKNITISFIKILCASLVMGTIAKVCYSILLNSINSNLSLILSIGIGAFTYFIIIYFMKIKEVDIIVSAVKNKLKRSVVNG